VAKQCKFLVAAACRSSEETYARLLGKLQLNGFEITAAEAEAEAGASGRENGDEEKASSDTRKNLREPVGLGVFPSASRFNHSCEPNCAQRFDAFACVVVETTRHVRQGEELTIPYVDVALNLEKRNERLERAFAFRCDCARCARERRA
jgi:SET and MYND domain-containing protein